jgi:hypothetical protein
MEAEKETAQAIGIILKRVSVHGFENRGGYRAIGVSLQKTA